MRTLAQQPVASQQNVSANTTLLGRAHFGQSRGVNSLLHSQRTYQGAQRNAEEREVELAGKTSPRLAHNFSQIPVHENAAIKMRPKLRINTPGDEFEQEADQLGTGDANGDSQVTSARDCGEGAACEECTGGSIVQRKATSMQVT